MGLRCIIVVMDRCEQGVFAHTSIVRQARRLGLTGSITELEGHTVRVQAEGPEQVLKQFIGTLKSFSVQKDDCGLLIRWMSYQGMFSDFSWVITPVDLQDVQNDG